MRPAITGALLALGLVSAPALAAESPKLTEAQEAQLELLRGEVASQLQLKAYDLLDELVYGWGEKPPFAQDTLVVLADVSVPVGFGSGLQALVENHFAELVTRNAKSHVGLAHCPACTSLVVHSGAKGTVIARGVDEPGALAQAGGFSGSHHALFLDFEVEGSSLVLRARITSLEPDLPIVYARTLSTSTSTPALLRTPEHLKSASEAHQEYVDALTGRSTFLIPVRMVVRNYAPPSDPSQGSSSPPFIWLQLGIEASLTQARAWTGSFSGGFTWLPQTHTGWMAQARVSRLLTGSAVSLTRPDLYAFAGASLMHIDGRSAGIFQPKVPAITELLAAQTGVDPSATLGAFQLGLELRLKNRIAAGAFLESLPSLDTAPGVGNYIDLGPVKFHSWGVEVTFCF